VRECHRVWVLLSGELTLVNDNFCCRPCAVGSFGPKRSAVYRGRAQSPPKYDATLCSTWSGIASEVKRQRWWQWNTELAWIPREKGMPSNALFADNIVFAPRGKCLFEDKSDVASAGGAAGLVVLNNEVL
jgi:hypothetical protein